MAQRNHILFESRESVFGFDRKSRDWIEYTVHLQFRASGKLPVSLDMVFVPPYPFSGEVPEEKKIRAATISDAFAKVAKFFRSYGFEMRTS